MKPITQQELEAMSANELKAIAYDLIADKEGLQRSLDVVNRLIAGKIQPAPIMQIQETIKKTK